MKKEFKIGDRVVIYDYGQLQDEEFEALRLTGTIYSFEFSDSDDVAMVELDKKFHAGDIDGYSAHVKQLRHLKPKPKKVKYIPKEIWVPKVWTPEMASILRYLGNEWLEMKGAGDYVHFREVLPKKKK